MIKPLGYMSVQAMWLNECIVEASWTWVLCPMMCSGPMLFRCAQSLASSVLIAYLVSYWSQSNIQTTKALLIYPFNISMLYHVRSYDTHRHCLHLLPQPMEHGRAAKLQKVESFRRACPYVTAAGMAAILQEIENHGAPALKQRKHFKEARDVRIAKHHAYGPLISELPTTLHNGESKTIPVVNVLSLLQALYSQDGSFTDLLKQTCRRAGCSAEAPLHLLYYNDEVVCGNPLAHDTTRKLQLVYGSVCEFGAHVLSKEESWFVTFCCRSSEVAKIQGGMSQVTARILKHAFHHDQRSLQHGGLLLKDSAGTHQRIFIKLGFMIQDGLAQKSIWSLKGDAGTRYCLFSCSNLVSARSNLDDDELLRLAIVGICPKLYWPMMRNSREH